MFLSSYYDANPHSTFESRIYNSHRPFYIIYYHMTSDYDLRILKQIYIDKYNNNYSVTENVVIYVYLS